MNKLYILLLLFYINIFCFNYSLSKDTPVNDQTPQILNSVQNSTANEIIKLLEGENKQVTYPCSHKFFKCRSIHNSDSNNNNNNNNKNDNSNESSYYSVTSISIPKAENNSIFLNITSDLTVFQDLETIKIRDESKVLLPSSFYNNLNKFKNIRKIVTYYQLSSINESITLPSSLSIYQVFYVGAKFSNNFFNSSLTKIIFNRALNGYEIPKEFNFVNEHLNSLTLPLSTISPYIPEATTKDGSSLSLPNLTTLSILVDVEMNKNQNFQFPSIESFSKLTNLSILTRGDEEKQSYELPNFSNMKQLNELYIYGNLFYSQNKSSVVLDLSNSQNFKSLYLWNNYFLKNCTTKPCIKFSNNSNDISITSTYAQFNISNLNFDNIGSLRVSFNKIEQPLPEIPLDKVLKELIIEYSKIVIPSIPESYCGRKFNISNNEIEAFVPRCFFCEKPLASIYLGNSFKNYDDSYTPSCPNFKIDNVTNSPIKTDGSEGVIISGNDIGYGILSDYDYQVLIPNKRIKVFPGKGFGKKKSIKLNFYYNPKFEYELDYSYQSPLIQFYNISYLNNNTTDDSNLIIMVMGQGFNYINENQFYINGNSYNGSIAKDESSTLVSNNGNGNKKFKSPFNLMKNGETFEIYIVVGDQKSKPSTFLYLKEPITIDNSSISNKGSGLNINGGEINIKGSFFTSDQSLVSASINNQPCKVLKVTESSISIKYPSVEKIGNYSFLLNIGGNIFNQIINYNSNSSESSENNNSHHDKSNSSESVDNGSSHNKPNNHNTTNNSSDNNNKNNTNHSSSHNNNDSTNDSDFFPNKTSTPTSTPSKTITPTSSPSQTPSQTHENIITTTPSPTPSPKTHTGIIVSVILVLLSIIAISLFIIYKKPELRYQIYRKLGLSRNGNRYSMLSREMMPNSFEDIDNEYENELDQFL